LMSWSTDWPRYAAASGKYAAVIDVESVLEMTGTGVATHEAFGSDG
jgi:hypothetical protein